MRCGVVLLVIGLWITSASAQSWILPTANRALYSGAYADYYMHVPRHWEGKDYQPWQGGQYGFVRTPVKSKGQVLYAKFHEGLDIRPTRRDARGDPLDVVWSVGSGTVVHVNPVTGHSSYGKYVVVEHNCEDGPYYSLYAHLTRATVEIGQAVRAGTPLGILGYTGPGLNRARAHLHFEINLLLDSQFNTWHGSIDGTGNPHGIYNGLNMVGIPVADYFLACRAKHGLSVGDFLKRREAHYRVVVPKEGSRVELVRRYRWLLTDRLKQGTAWEISFDGSGIPLKVESVTPDVLSLEPQVSWVKSSPHYHTYQTRTRLTRAGDKLTSRGARFVSLVAGRF
ncbi:MAG: murein DD-endopeptidase MepM/ murein hydrolase activator NlpD [Verrucomicrobiales bacterium]|jgi:murein DD-endopeptidase MepM/ murein hydrolase activator NlpD